MGTRGLTIVKVDGETKVAQYGQWDHYPSGQGVTVLDFLKNFNEEQFRNQLKKCQFIDNKKQEEIDHYLKSIGSNNGWMSIEQSELYHVKYPYLSRDHGAGILNLINESEDETIWIQDSIDFKNQYPCEGVYTVDLDNRTFTIEWDDYEYVFNINDLPTTEEFLTICEPEEEEF